MTDLLSQNEIDDLLNAISKGDLDTEDYGLNNWMQPKVKIYDWKRQDKFSRENIRSIQMIFERFTRLATTALSTRLNLPCGVHVTSVDQLTYEEFIRSVPNPTTMAVLGMDPLKGYSVLEIDPAITFSIIERLHGGNGEHYKINRNLTDIEISAMESITLNLLGYLRESWADLIDLRPRLSGVESNPKFVQIAPSNEMTILITMETIIGEVEGMMNFCIPQSLIKPLLPKLTTKYFFRDRSIEKENEINLDEVTTTCTIEQGNGAYISLKDFEQLKKGDNILFSRENLYLNYSLCSNGQTICKLDLMDDNKFGFKK